jgi:transcriptional regulator with XRE-family HTH domain
MKDDIVKKFGIRLREKRLLLGLSQEELAEKADVHRTYIGMLERGEKNVTLKNIEKIASALCLPINDLMNFEE